MRISLIAVGERLPDWVRAGYQDYARRLAPECALRLVEIAPSKRYKSGDIQRAKEEEGLRILSAIPKNALVIALEEGGQQWASVELAETVRQWMQGGRDVAMLIGGPDGLDPKCREKAEVTWSLSRLTLPHALVRIVLVEQLYRAWMIIRKHPYHRY